MNTFFGTLNADGSVTENLSVDLSKVPSSDPIAFAYGVARGRSMANDDKPKSYSPKKIHGSNFSGLAKEYLRGFLFGYKGILVPEGTKIVKGQEMTLALMNKNILKK